MVKDNMTNREIRDIVISNNTLDHDLLKLAEECTELSEVLIKMVTKPNRREEKIPHLIEEMGDVSIRGKILAQRLGLIAHIKDREESKMRYIEESIASKKYTNCY